MNGSRSFLASGLFRVGAVLLFLVSVVAILVAVPELTGGGGDTVHITMWTSGEKLNYLKDVVAEFNREDHKTSNGRAIRVEAYTVNSGTQSDHLINNVRDGVPFPQGITPPHIASPSVDHWLTRVNYLSGVEVFDLASTKPLALTPVVIAMYEEMARTLGWPQKELGWADIIALAGDPRGWSAYPGARVEWGKKPLLAWTDPNVSSTARTALFAAYVAASGKSAEQLTVQDVHDPTIAQYVHSLQGAVDHYFPETLKLQTKIFQGPRFLHFAPLEEYNLVWLKRGLVNAESVPGAKPEARPLDRKMVAIYPKEGTIWHNNPGAILQNVPWTTPEQQEAARIFVDYLLAPPQQQEALEWGFRPANPKVPNGEFLTAEYGIDPNKPTKILGPVDPAVAEEILSNWQEVKKPGVVVLVLDVSGSMSGEKLAQAKEGALQFIDTVSVNTHVGLVTFSSTVNKAVPIAPVQTNKFDLAASIERTQASGGTALYDAIKAALEMVDVYALPGEAIRGVIVLSDGASNQGSVKLSDLFRLNDTQERQITNFPGTEREDKSNVHGSQIALPLANQMHIFSIGYGKDADLHVLRIFSEATNSTFNTATEKNIAQVLEIFGKYF